MAAPTLAFSVESASPPAGHVAHGNLVVANTSGADISVTAIEIVMASRQGFQPVQVASPSGASYAGTGGPGVTVSNGGSVSFGFDYVAVGGDLRGIAYTSDGTNPTATQTITPT